ncbi:unnamed protein product [Closterium sp. NIES-64]|nr:unnamed protein product [Closterium sp. NIES-64]CAI6011569.1 unnamed protein product [Closterium sp. NIES-65]
MQLTLTLMAALALIPSSCIAIRRCTLQRLSPVSRSPLSFPRPPHFALSSPSRTVCGRAAVRRFATMAAGYQESDAVREARDLVAELCRHFYTLGWVSGTGGSISIKANEPGKTNQERTIVMAPSGVQKERMIPEDMYVMAPDGTVLVEPKVKPPPHKAPKCSECGPLFLKCFEMRGAGAVIHSHGMETAMATMLVPGAKDFRISHMEMIKGIVGHGYYDELVVPIIENTAREYELTDSLAAAIEAYPKATAVLVRNHGVYIWGDNWIQAKTQAECYHYLFDAAIRMHQMGINPCDPLHLPAAAAAAAPAALAATSGGKTFPKFIVLDIEGTTTPISFVSQVLFPYAKSHVGQHLLDTFDTPETQADMLLLRAQIEEDIKSSVPGAEPVPPLEAGKEAVVGAVERNVAAMIAADRKVTALKQLQGHIWRGGYEKGELKGEFFSDVLTALTQWQAAGCKIYIYSSGSREAQHLIFGYSNVGDLRRFISGFFDTTTGHKREARSYSEIALTLGAHSPSDITFCTDILEEAQAAKQAGLQAVLLSRPGNGALPADPGFPVLTSLTDL